jgi:hypothetical protein
MILGILILLQGVGLEISVGIVEHAVYFILFYFIWQNKQIMLLAKQAYVLCNLLQNHA